MVKTPRSQCSGHKLDPWFGELIPSAERCRLKAANFFKKQGKKLRLPWWLGGKDLPANAGDTGPIPGPGRPHMLQSD